VFHEHGFIRHDQGERCVQTVLNVIKRHIPRLHGQLCLHVQDMDIECRYQVNRMKIGKSCDLDLGHFDLKNNTLPVCHHLDQVVVS